MKVRQLVTLVLLLVCIGLLPLHSGAIGLDGYSLWTLSRFSFPTIDQPVDLLARAPVVESPSDSRHAPTTPAIPHCDFEVSSIDHPPLCVFAPPESVRSDNNQHDPSPLFFTIAPTPPPPRHA